MTSGKQGQYFEGVPPEVWNFHIGGYQVCEKWLKDRRERTLSYDDQLHYAKVVTALQEAIRPMAAIEAAPPSGREETWPGDQMESKHTARTSFVFKWRCF